jgi:hypothetical protein
MVALAFTGGCTAVTVRPGIRPFPGAAVDTVAGEPDSIVTRLATAIEALGVRLRRRSAAEGYLETVWYDLAARRARGSDHLPGERIIKLRAWADALPPGESVVVVEAVYRLSADPSQPERELEAVVPAGHPADSMVQHLLTTLEPR